MYSIYFESMTSGAFTSIPIAVMIASGRGTSVDFWRGRIKYSTYAYRWCVVECGDLVHMDKDIYDGTE